MHTQKTIGIVGGGQLGRMLTLAALPLGFKVIVIDPTDNCPAAQVGAEQIHANLYDQAAIEALGHRADYVTVEIEHLDTTALKKLVADGISVNPTPETIQLIQDKYLQKQFLIQHNIPVAPFEVITSSSQASTVLKSCGGSMVLKTRHGAYDGRGNALVTNTAELNAALAKFEGISLYAESVIPFKKELAVMIAVDIKGNTVVYPVVETIQANNICTEVLAPADLSATTQAQAIKLASQVGSHLDGAGVYGIEMFLTADDQVLVNEIAPRVHNSGHYTMEACATSQFEQHIRAIAHLPLGDTRLIHPAAVMINILGDKNAPTEVIGLDQVLQQKNTKVHLYGKSPTKIDRKMGHITVTGGSVDEARKTARHAKKQLSI